MEAHRAYERARQGLLLIAREIEDLAPAQARYFRGVAHRVEHPSALGWFSSEAWRIPVGREDLLPVLRLVVADRSLALRTKRRQSARIAPFLAARSTSPTLTGISRRA